MGVAEDFWFGFSCIKVMNLNEKLANECRRIASNTCLYTSTSLFEWLRFLRTMQVIFMITPVIFGSLATWNILTEAEVEGVRFSTAIFAFLAGLIPAIYGVLKLDEHIIKTSRLAGEFKNLQDRFDIAATVSSQKPFEDFEREVNGLLDRLELARAESYTAPQLFFWLARKKIRKGLYTPD